MPARGRVLRVGVLASGRGTGVCDLARASSANEVAAVIPAVVVNEPGAGVIARASECGVPVTVIDHRAFETRHAFEEALVTSFRQADVDLVFALGFRRLLTATFLEAFVTLNVHPSLLPAFPGLHAVADALAQGAVETGATVHRVDLGTDTGPILARASVAIRPGDDANSLHARIQLAERALVRSVVSELASRVEGGSQAQVEQAVSRIVARCRATACSSADTPAGRK